MANKWITAAPQTGSSAPLTLPSPPGQRGERVKGASSERRFGGFEKPVLTLSPDSPAPATGGWGETLRKRRPLAASETKKSKTLEDNYYPPSFSWQGETEVSSAGGR